MRKEEARQLDEDIKRMRDMTPEQRRAYGQDLNRRAREIKDRDAQQK